MMLTLLSRFVLFQEEKLDVLINNAGVMNCRKSLTNDGIETQLETNHMAPFLLTNLLKPYLKSSGITTNISVV